MRKTLYYHVTNIMDGIYVNRYKQAALGFSVIFMSLFSIITIRYMITLKKFSPSNAWKYQISVKCPVSASLSELLFQDAVFVEYGLCFFIAGAYFGLLIDAKNYKGSIK